MDTYFESNEFDKIWGLFDSAISPEQASLEPGRTGYKLIFANLDEKKAKAAFENLNRVNNKQDLFAKIQGAYGESKGTQDIILPIKEGKQEELVAYLQEKGVKHAAEMKTKEQKINEQVAWSKPLAAGVLADLSNLWTEIPGNHSLKDQIQTMQNRHLVAICDTGPDAPTTGVEFTAVSIAIKSFLEEANRTVESERGKAILETLQERITEATHEVDVAAEKKEERNEALDKFVKKLRDRGEDKIADSLESLADQPEALVKRLHEIQKSGKLKHTLVLASKPLQASLNGVGAASMAM